MEDSFVALVLDQLRGVEGLGCRAMFGGHGLYSGPTLFGLVAGGRLYFKTGDATVSEYVRRGMKSFAPRFETLRTFYELPADVLGDAGRLAEWARAAARCAEGAHATGQRTYRPPAARLAVSALPVGMSAPRGC